MFLRVVAKFQVAPTLTSSFCIIVLGLSEPGVPGGFMTPHILSDQLTLSPPGGGRLCPPHYYWSPRILRPSHGPALYNPADLSEVELDYPALK